jgi:tetratricopeptide (TPR) repeat protein
MKVFFVALFVVCFGYQAISSPTTDSLFNVLKTELANKKNYDDQKETRITELKNKLAIISKTDYSAQYNISVKLYEEYKVFQFDSAYVYTQKLLNISLVTHDITRQYESRIKLGFILLSAGMFKETFDCLNQINSHFLNDSSRLEYYALKARAYSDLADYNNDKNYTSFDNQSSIKYLDSAIQMAKPESFEMLMHLGDRQLISGMTQQPSVDYIRLLDHYNLTSHQRAMVATGLSSFYLEPSQKDERIRLLTIGAINDIRSSTKETLAIFKLGELLYHDGDYIDAYTCIQQAMADAQYYGARLRKIKIAAVLPLVDAQKIIKAENEKNRFLIYFLSIAAISLLITLIFFIVFIQLKRLKAKEKIIEEKNVLLEKINNKLNEDTHIKEEYIGYFFNVISGYILKLEKLKRSVERKISTKKYDDVLLTVNEINIKKERETLFYTFDHVFLKIFPNFITMFNSLLKKEDQIWPKDNEVLNTDLRIFALMRLGINDNETIANILEYSVNTIYVYKMRIKAKSLVPNDQFEHKIMAIKAVDILSKN